MPLDGVPGRFTEPFRAGCAVVSAVSACRRGCWCGRGPDRVAQAPARTRRRPGVMPCVWWTPGQAVARILQTGSSRTPSVPRQFVLHTCPALREPRTPGRRPANFTDSWFELPLRQSSNDSSISSSRSSS